MTVNLLDVLLDGDLIGGSLGLQLLLESAIGWHWDLSGLELSLFSFINPYLKYSLSDLEVGDEALLSDGVGIRVPVDLTLEGCCLVVVSGDSIRLYKKVK